MGDRSILFSKLRESVESGSQEETLILLEVLEECLGDNTKAVDRYFYIKEQRLSGRSLADIGKELGISRQRVHQILSKSLKAETKYDEYLDD